MRSSARPPPAPPAPAERAIRFRPDCGRELAEQKRGMFRVTFGCGDDLSCAECR